MGQCTTTRESNEQKNQTQKSTITIETTPTKVESTMTIEISPTKVDSLVSTEMTTNMKNTTARTDSSLTRQTRIMSTEHLTSLMATARSSSSSNSDETTSMCKLLNLVVIRSYFPCGQDRFPLYCLFGALIYVDIVLWFHWINMAYKSD